MSIANVFHQKGGVNLHFLGDCKQLHAVAAQDCNATTQMNKGFYCLDLTKIAINAAFK